jgi:hypothetical protein
MSREKKGRSTDSNKKAHEVKKRNETVPIGTLFFIPAMVVTIWVLEMHF